MALKNYRQLEVWKKGSLIEGETHRTIAVRLGFVSRHPVLETWRLARQVGQLLTNLTASLEMRSARPPAPDA